MQTRLVTTLEIGLAAACLLVGVAAAHDDSPPRPDRKSTPSELQSQSNLVCRLLLEKKKTSDMVRRAPVLRRQRLVPRHIHASAPRSLGRVLHAIAWIRSTSACSVSGSRYRLPVDG